MSVFRGSILMPETIQSSSMVSEDLPAPVSMNKGYRGAVTACQIFFSARIYVARPLIGKLMREDLAIAYREAIQSYTKRKFRPLITSNRYHTRDLAKFAALFCALDSFIDDKPGENSQKVFCGDTHDNSITPRDIQSGHYFVGNIPSRKLKFGEYLFYSGAISKEELQAAIQWQRSVRPLFGQLALKSGYISIQDFARVLARVKNGEMFGEVARELGVLSDAHIASILKQQIEYNCPIGKYFLDNSILDKQEMRAYLADHAAHNGR